CLSVNGHTLLYVGISPKNESSSQNLRKRITYHYRGNAEGSTLRLTLGVLLAQQSDFPLRRVRGTSLALRRGNPTGAT
ncbi:GIY-YIG nuclease family protein, partial [Rhodovarius sp.]|uniref:GIY-YIG nuclease family protein n=1 Tax=Rhodovarius sp. TaxID=2972673 RepID=UPI0034A5575E